jgi:GNAT superfamily N-acetyltransferase
MDQRGVAQLSNWYSVRQATEADIPVLLELGRSFWVQTLYHKADIEFDEQSCIEIIQMCLSDGVALMAEVDDQLVGMILVPVVPVLMNHNYRCATEWVYYIDPEWRGSGLGRDILEQAEAELRAMRVKMFNMVLLENVTPEVAAHLYEEMGFALAERVYMKDLQ